MHWRSTPKGPLFAPVYVYRSACIVLLAVAPLPGRVAPAGQADRPPRLQIDPAGVRLAGANDRAQLIVSGVDGGGARHDLTPAARFQVAPPGVVVVEGGGLVRPVGDGKAEITVTAGGASRRVPVAVTGAADRKHVSFRHEVIAAFNVAGCNSGACHGTPSGKGGFKLSLRGYDPEADLAVISRDGLNRRAVPLQPAASLLLQKGAGKVPHEGGVRLRDGDLPYRLIHDWIAAGLPEDPKDLPPVRRLEILPGSQVLKAPFKAQQLAARAHFADGSVRDVTRLCVFTSSDDGVARVSPEGKVEFAARGEVSIQARYLLEMANVRLTYVNTPPGYRWPEPPEHNFVDRHLFAKLKLLGIPPSDLADDAEFLRRAYLDLLGVLPTPAEVEAFLGDKRLDKRGRLIDRLLERPEYVDYWALRWTDVLSANRRAVQAKGAYLLHQWFRQHLKDNTPLDQVARELLTASGSTFVNAPANYFRNDRKVRPPEDLAQNTAQLLLGIRMSCARCHNHPFERWTQDDYYGMAAFFARVKGRPDPLYPRLNRFNLGALDVYHARSGEVTHPRTRQPVEPSFPGGQKAKLEPGQDRREALARWLTAPDNPFFARNMVNRVWYHLFGKGIVDPVDDFRDSNPAASEELLDALARDLVRHDYDVRHLIRTVMNSRCYQLSSRPNEFNRDDDRYFSHAQSRMHPAEVLLDALSSATEAPEVFAGTKPGTRATQLPDGDVYKHPFLKAFGQPARETVCECERNADTSLGHALQLVNGQTLKSKLEARDNRIGRLLAARRSDDAILKELYLATLSRLPTAGERKATLGLIAGETDRRKGWEDVHWALINSKEFLFRH